MRNAFVCAGLLLAVSACSEAPSSGPAASGTPGSAGLASIAGGAMTAGTGGSSSEQAGSSTTPPGGDSALGGAGGSGATHAGGSSGGTAGGSANTLCDPELTDSNRALVASALDALFVDKQVSAIDQYWADPYLQHNPIAKSGVATFKSIMGPVVSSPSFSYERLRTLAECDLVVVQGRYSGTGVIFDMFRVEGGKLVEHWDSDANQASDAGGTTENPPVPETRANRERVLAFVQSILIENKHADASQFLSPNLVVHRTSTGSGPTALLDYLATETITYSKVHHVIADGSFVFTLSEGTRDGMPYGFYDLFRLESGQIVEHWDSRRPVPTSTASGLGIF